MNMRRILAIAQTDLLLTLKDKGSLLWLFVMPLVFTASFGTLMGPGDDDAPDKTSIPIVVHDSGFLARAVLDQLNTESTEAVQYEEGDSLLAKRKSWLTIPAGFTDSVRAGRKTPLSVMSLDGASKRRVDNYAWEARRAALRVLLNAYGIPESLMTGGTDEELAASYATLAALPDEVSIESRNALALREVPRGFQFTVPGNIVMFVLIVALTSGASIVASNVEGGHFRRLGSAPVTIGEIYWGKVAGLLLVAAVQIAFLVIVSTILFRMQWGGSPFALAGVLAALALAASSLGVFLGLSIGKTEVVAPAGVLITLTMAALGGCWWPIEIVSGTMKKVAMILPTGWAMAGLQRIISYNGDLVSVLPVVGLLLGFSLFFALLGIRLIRFDAH